MTFVIIGCFCSVIFIPLGIALMWFYSAWKKKTKFKDREEQKQKIISTCKEISESLDKLYAQKCDEWVDIIVKNVVGE